MAEMIIIVIVKKSFSYPDDNFIKLTPLTKFYTFNGTLRTKLAGYVI